MEFNKIAKILECEGYNKKIEYSELGIKEIDHFQGGEFYFLVKECDLWRLGYVSKEREPKEETIKIYTSLKSGSNSFFLNRLNSHYLHKYISKAEKDTHIVEALIAKELNMNHIIHALSQCNIPELYLSTQSKNNHSIRIQEYKDGWISEYIDKIGESHKRTNPVSLHECLAFVFTRIMYLYLLDNVTEKYFGGIKPYEYFTDDEIAEYVS